MSGRRWTDTAKWSDPWFRTLNPTLKLAWVYILENVDKAGFWLPEWDVLSLRLGVEVDPSKALEAFSSRVFCHAGGLWQIRDYFAAQYPGQRPGRCHGVAMAAFKQLSQCEAILGSSVLDVAGVNLKESTSEHSGGAPGGVNPGCETKTEAKAEAETEAEATPSAAPGIEGQLIISLLQGVARSRAHVFPAKMTGPFVQAAVELAQAHGATRVEKAFALYLDSRLRVKTVQNYLEHAAHWLNQIPGVPSACPHDRAPVVTVRDLDAYPHGEKERVEACPDCGKKLNVKRFRPEHEHDWRLVDADALNAGRAKLGLEPVEPEAYCTRCGAGQMTAKV